MLPNSIKVPPAALVVFVRGKFNRISFNSIIFVIFCMAIYAALFHFFCIYLRIRIQQAITSFIFLRFVWLLNIQKNNINIYSINFKDFTLEMSLCTSKQDPYSFLQQSRVCLVLWRPLSLPLMLRHHTLRLFFISDVSSFVSPQASYNSERIIKNATVELKYYLNLKRMLSYKYTHQWNKKNFMINKKMKHCKQGFKL